MRNSEYYNKTIRMHVNDSNYSIMNEQPEEKEEEEEREKERESARDTHT